MTISSKQHISARVMSASPAKTTLKKMLNGQVQKEEEKDSLTSSMNTLREDKSNKHIKIELSPDTPIDQVADAALL